MQFRFIFLTSHLLLVLLGPIQANPNRVQFYYNLAEGNYLIGDNSGAARGIEQSLRLDPEHAPSHALRARILLSDSNAPEALQSIERAIHSAPTVVEYPILRALILGNLDRRAEALTVIDEVLQAADTSQEEKQKAQTLKGLLQMAESNWDEAANAFRQSYFPKSGNESAGRQLATEAYLEKARSAPDLRGAIEAIEDAISLYDGLSGRENLEILDQLRLNRARLLAQAGRAEEAARSIQRIVGQNPENLEAVITLASLYVAEENWAALEDLIEPISRSPALTDVALYLEGRLALSRDRVGTARQKFEAAIEINQNNPSSLEQSLRFYRSICLERLDRPTEAEIDLQSALAAGYIPESSEAYVHLGKLLFRTGEIDLLIRILEQALLRNESSPEGWAILGRAHLRKSQTSLAISALNQSLLQRPQQVETLALRGSLLRRIGDFDGALADYERARAMNASSPVLHYETGLTYLQLGRIAQAEPHLRVAAAQLEDQPAADLLHAICAYLVGDFSASAASLNRFLEPARTAGILAGSESNRSEAAFYLRSLLSKTSQIQLPEIDPPNEAATLFVAYDRGDGLLKDLLDHAGRAETALQARRQIVATAFWLAEFELAKGRSQAARDLFSIALESGQQQQPEFQFARWRLEQINAGRAN